MRKVSRAINSSPEMPSKQKLPSKSEAAQFDALALAMSDDDDDFQNPSHAFSLTQNLILSSFEKPTRVSISQPLKPSNGTRSSKKTKSSTGIGKENARVASVFKEKKGFEAEKGCVRNSTGFGVSESSMSCSSIAEQSYSVDGVSTERIMEKGLDMEAGCSSNLIESGSLESSGNCCSRVDNRCCVDGDFGYGVSAECNDKNRNKSDKGYVLASMESQLLEPSKNCSSSVESVVGDGVFAGWKEKKGFLLENGYLSNSIESRLLASKMESNSIANSDCLDECSLEDFEPGTQLNVLMKMCSELGEEGNSNGVDFWEGNGSGDGLVECPLCGIDISDLGEEQRHVHTNCCLDREEQGRVQTNECLDRDEIQKVVPPCVDMRPGSPPRVVDVSPVLEWLCSLGLSRYEEAFVREEIDWDTLQWLTEEDLFSIGVTALGPRKKIVHALSELRKGSTHTEDAHTDDASKITIDRTNKLAGNKLITEYFSGSFVDRKRDCTPVRGHRGVGGSNTDSGQRRIVVRDHARKGKLRDIPLWCCIPGTPFRVDAFRYLRGDCSHWFLTHFHTDHYQGLTRNFRHGKIYCSSITAQLVNMKIGIPWDRLQVLPLNQKISIENVDVTCLDANHCPGSIIILFEPPNGKAVLHTGDFRFSEEMKCMSVLQRCPVHTLILDTTYCNPQYDFPKQEAVIQFVIEAIQAEDFNPKTLFLIGSYTIGKERLFLEVARVLRKKVYVGAAKLRLLECLGLPKEDMQWFTMNEQESHIHVVPMWTIASFKRMKHLSTQYLGRFNLIVAFSPTGWTFGKGKKKTPGRRWQQGTIIRYEIPYSEHCSFTELREFVQFVSPENIIPSVNNDGPESTDAMISLLVS